MNHQCGIFAENHSSKSRNSQIKISQIFLSFNGNSKQLSPIHAAECFLPLLMMKCVESVWKIKGFQVETGLKWAQWLPRKTRNTVTCPMLLQELYFTVCSTENSSPREFVARISEEALLLLSSSMSTILRCFLCNHLPHLNPVSIFPVPHRSNTIHHQQRHWQRSFCSANHHSSLSQA
jgi:hypothetical protein